MKIKPVARIWSSGIISAMLTQHFLKRNNKLINICEIKLFHLVLGDLRCFYRYPLELTLDWLKLCVWANIYLYLPILWVGSWFTLHFSFTIHKNGKITRTRSIPKSNYTHFKGTVQLQLLLFIINFPAIMCRPTIVQNGIISTICACVLLVRLINIERPNLKN